MVVCEQKWLYSGKTSCFGVKVVVYSKVVVFRQCGCIRAKVFCNRAKGFLSGKVVVFLQGGCYQAKVVVSRQKDL